MGGFEALVDADGALRGESRTAGFVRPCRVFGCRREAVLSATRVRSARNGEVVVVLDYCVEHYGQANRFHAADER